MKKVSGGSLVCDGSNRFSVLGHHHKVVMSKMPSLLSIINNFLLLALKKIEDLALFGDFAILLN